MLKTHEQYVDVEAYFAQEEISEYRSEYYCGELFSMTGGTTDHNRITLTMAGLLNTQFRGRHCEAFASDMRIQVRKNYHYAYPDVVVVCGELELAEGRSDTLILLSFLKYFPIPPGTMTGDRNLPHTGESKPSRIMCWLIKMRFISSIFQKKARAPGCCANTGI